jgi:hypothetical protein
MGADLVKTIKRTGNNPVKDNDISTLGQNTAAQWKNNPGLTLVWITQAEHEANVQAFASTLGERMNTGSGRKEITGKLAALDKEINKGISNIKNFLVYKFGRSAAPTYYPQFGIEHNGHTFIAPKDRNKRAAALPLIVQAVATHGITDETYGQQFWQTTTASYLELMQQASNIDGTVSAKVGAKNEMRKTIKKTHNALINLLKANYPDTYTTVLRNWGFQKEKY